MGMKRYAGFDQQTTDIVHSGEVEDSIIQYRLVSKSKTNLSII